MTLKVGIIVRFILEPLIHSGLWRRKQLLLTLHVVLVCAPLLCIQGCASVVFEAAKMTMEDRPASDFMTDTQIAASIISMLAQKDGNLLLDINTDVWEQRVMLTGTVADQKTRDDIVQRVRSDLRVRKVYDEIYIVSPDEMIRRRDAARNSAKPKKEGFGRLINDFWIETKISARLISTKDVTSVNYRWRSVRNVIYMIGRAQTRDEFRATMDVLRTVEGVTLVKSFVEIKPVVKASLQKQNEV